MLQRLPNHLNGRTLDSRQADSLIFSVGLHHFRCREYLNFDDFVWPLFPAQFRYVIINARYLESHVQLVDRCEPCKFTNDVENLVLQALQFQKVGICNKFPGEANISYYCFNLRLWRVSLMLTLNRSLLNNFGTDRTENISSNSSSIIAYWSVASVTWRLLNHCLATGVFAGPFLNNGCLCWLHNSSLRKASHNIFKINFSMCYTFQLNVCAMLGQCQVNHLVINKGYATDIPCWIPEKSRISILSA
jgi:hypothetical protein